VVGRRTVLKLSLGLLCACSGTSDRVEVRVFAAASLTDAFTDLAAAFEVAHPDVSVRLNIAGSQTLRQQIEHGARADVFASANIEHYRALRAAGEVEPGQTLAYNRLALLVPTQSPLWGAADLARVERLVVGAPEVPIGRYTASLLGAADAEFGSGYRAAVRARIASREHDVRLLRSRVLLGVADAAIVYRSDWIKGLRIVAFPESINPPTELIIGLGTGSPAASDAAVLVAFCRSAAGQKILVEHGFEAVQ
jgi:molybdate transport system substrate-binding protein